MSKTVAVAETLRGLQDREEELDRLIEEADAQAVKPIADSWQDVQTLADLLDTAEDKADIRIRLRSAIRRIVRDVWMIVVRRGLTQLCAAQVFFHAGETENNHREFLLVHRRRGGNQKNRPPVQPQLFSLGETFDPSASGALDLRQAGDAAALAKVLAEIDLAEFAAAERSF